MSQEPSRDRSDERDIVRLVEWRTNHNREHKEHDRDHDSILNHLDRIEARLFQLILAVLALAGVGIGVAVTITSGQ